MASMTANLGVHSETNQAKDSVLFLMPGVWRVQSEWGNDRIVSGCYVPSSILDTYIARALRLVSHNDDDDGVTMTVEGFPGVWACADTIVETLAELEEVLRDWVNLKLLDDDLDLPVVDGIDLRTTG